LLLLVALLATGAALTQALAAPLDADTCHKMMVEQDALESAGVEQELAKGPEWAKLNLSPQKIEQIRRFIELEEMILFRCRSKQRVVLPPDPDEVEAKEKAEREKADKAKAQAKDPNDDDKEGLEKNETVLSKSTPVTAKAKEASPALKGDPKQQKAQDKQKTGKAKAEPKTAPKTEPKAPAKKPDPKVQAKATPPAASKPGAPPSQKVVPKAKAEPEPKAEKPPDLNPFGQPFADTPK
jgi:hypothetical protein